MTIAPAWPFVCGLFHLVDISWNKVIAEPSLIQQQLHGLMPGQLVPQVHRMVWPHERFARDDIDDAEVQRGLVGIKVGTVCRQFWPTASTTLMHYKGHVRVCIQANTHDPYFAGYAPDLAAAATWVATGAGSLVIPWKTP